MESHTVGRRGEPEQLCADASDLARRCAEEIAGPGQVGEHQGIVVDADRVVTHLFSCLSPAYVGWTWAVTVTRAATSKVVTVSETVLLPGPGSLVAPDWVPWTERVRPGDLKAGDLMPARSDDERLTPLVALGGDESLLDWGDPATWRDSGWRDTDLPEAGGSDVPGDARPAGLRPSRVVSAIGRGGAAARGYQGQHGPRSP